MKFSKKSFIIILLIFVVAFLSSNCVSAVDTNKVWITHTPTGGVANSQSSNPSVSADGRYVAFESYASNIGNGSSGRGIQDIYVYDYQTNTTEWITHSSTGGAANGNSYVPSISGDGRYVVFASKATNLGKGGSGNGIKDIFVYDRDVGKVTKWITQSPTGGPASNSSNNPVISADGTTIAFQSTAKNLGTGGSEYYVSDIYIYDLTSSASDNYPQWITHTMRGYTANGASTNPSINANGRYIAFETVATNLGPLDFMRYGSGNGVKDIFCYDKDTDTMEWLTLSIPKVSVEQPAGTYNTSFSANLLMNQTGTIYWSLDNSTWEIYSEFNQPYIDQTTYLYFYGETIDGRISNLVSEHYIFPIDDSPIIWASPSTGIYYNFVDVNLSMNLPGTIYYSTGGSYTIYTGTLTFIRNTTLRFYGIVNDEIISNPGVESYTILPLPLSVGGINPSISADGTLVSYQSGNSIDKFMEYVNISPQNTETIGVIHDNIFVFNRLTGVHTLITQTIDGKPANGTSANPSISGDGRYVAFESTANNLGIDPNQPYGSNMPGVVFYNDSFRRDIFKYDLTTSSIFYLDWITHDTIYGPANGNSYTPSLNEDGSILAFSSSAYNFGPGGTRVYRDIFLFDKNLVVSADKNSGNYKGPLTVNLSLINSSGNIYFTIDGSDPFSGSLYTGPIIITSDTLLRFIGTDGSVWSSNYSRNYTIKKPPSVTASPSGGTYNSVKTVTLVTIDPDSSAITYYTTDGSDPTTSATRKTYTSPILIDSTTVLRFVAVDPDGNWSPNNSQTYTINLPADMITIAQINAAAASVRTYYENHSKKLPSSITINGSSYNMAQLLYLLVTATRNIDAGNLNPVKAKAVNMPTSPSGTIVSGNIVKTSYLTYAKSIQYYINTNGRAPNYLATSLGKMQLKYTVYMYCKIVNYYLTNNRLPNYVSMVK
jgi:Tol biopolymer transport system component